VINLSVLACPNQCAERDADGCQVCDDGYKLDTEKKCMPTITAEEAGGVSGGAIAGIVCGSVVIVSLAAWVASRFVQKKFPFQPKKYLSLDLINLRFQRAPNKIHHHRKNASNPEVTNLVSPSQNELNTLVP